MLLVSLALTLHFLLCKSTMTQNPLLVSVLLVVHLSGYRSVSSWPVEDMGLSSPRRSGTVPAAASYLPLPCLRLDYKAAACKLVGLSCFLCTLQLCVGQAGSNLHIVLCLARHTHTCHSLHLKLQAQERLAVKFHSHCSAHCKSFFVRTRHAFCSSDAQVAPKLQAAG